MSTIHQVDDAHTISIFSSGAVTDGDRAVIVNLMQPHCYALRLAAANGDHTVSTILSVHVPGPSTERLQDDPREVCAIAILNALMNSPGVLAALDTLLAAVTAPPPGDDTQNAPDS
jgi:hypothetical protein